MVQYVLNTSQGWVRAHWKVVGISVTGDLDRCLRWVALGDERSG